MSAQQGGGLFGMTPTLNQDVTTLMEKFRRGRGYGPYGNVEVKVEMLSPSIATVTFSRPPLKPSIFASSSSDADRLNSKGRSHQGSAESSSSSSSPVSGEIVTQFEVAVGVGSGNSCTWSVVEPRVALGGTNQAAAAASRGIMLLQPRLLHDILKQRQVLDERASSCLQNHDRYASGLGGSKRALFPPHAGVHSGGASSLSGGVSGMQPSRFVEDVVRMLDLWGSLELDAASLTPPRSLLTSSAPPASPTAVAAASPAGVPTPHRLEGRPRSRGAAAIFLPSGAIVLPPKGAAPSPRSPPLLLSSPHAERPRGNSAFSSVPSGNEAAFANAVAPMFCTRCGPDEKPLESLVCSGSCSSLLPRAAVLRVVLCGMCPVNALVANGELVHQVNESANRPEIAPLFHSVAASLEGAIRDGGRSYLKIVLAPTLINAVWAMVARREPFWAGVCVCCVLLPGILGTKREWLDLSLLPMQLASVVDVVRFAFCLLGDPVRSLEAATVSEALEAAHRSRYNRSSTSSDFASPSSGGSVESGRPREQPRNCSFSLHHKPICSCAVCGQGLQRACRAKARGTFPEMDGEPPVEGSIIVQCLVCGHGGHVNCIQMWQGQRRGCCAVGSCGCECRFT